MGSTTRQIIRPTSRKISTHQLGGEGGGYLLATHGKRGILDMSCLRTTQGP